MRFVPVRRRSGSKPAASTFRDRGSRPIAVHASVELRADQQTGAPCSAVSCLRAKPHELVFWCPRNLPGLTSTAPSSINLRICHSGVRPMPSALATAACVAAALSLPKRPCTRTALRRPPTRKVHVSEFPSAWPSTHWCRSSNRRDASGGRTWRNRRATRTATTRSSPRRRALRLEFRHLPDPHRDVEALFQQVDLAIGDLERDIDAGIAPHECGQQRVPRMWTRTEPGP